MENHKILGNLLNTLFESLDTSSWSIYEDKFGMTVCRIKFSPKQEDSATKDNIEQTPIGYKRKSVTQLQRDQSRMSRYNKEYNTRSQNKTVLKDNEIMRDTYEDTFSNSGLSPEPVYEGASAAESPFQITAHSPAVPPSIHMSPDFHAKFQTSAESEACISLPDMRAESECQSELDGCYAHAATHDDLNNIICYECGTSAPVTLSLFGCEMFQCDKCINYYVCGVCVHQPQKRHTFKCQNRLKYINT